MLRFKLSKKKRKLIIGVLILLTTLIYQSLQTKSQKSSTQVNNRMQPTATSSAEFIRVSRVIDGDTIELENKQKVRYIGIDTPELHDPRKPVECFAQEAMQKNKKLVEGKTVRLEKDVSETDKYHRLLRYVYVNTTASPAGEFVNDFLVKKGYASAATFPPDVKFSDQFNNSEKFARVNKLGLWHKCRE